MTEPTSPTPERVDTSRAAFRVGAGIFLSRVLGFARDALLSRFLGATAVMDVWAAAMRTPNVIQVLLGEGTLSASVIPVYSEMLGEGREEEAGRFAGAALGLVTVLAWTAALVGIAIAPAIARYAFPQFTLEQQTLLTTLMRILFPMVAFIAMSAWALAILNSHGRFFTSYVAPALWNLSMITVLVFFGLTMGWAAQGREVDLVVALAWGALVGGLLQLLIQIPWLVPVLGRFRLSVSTHVSGMGQAIRNFVPVVAARGIVGLSGLVDMIIAGILAPGAISGLYFAQRLYYLPISLFGLSVAAAELPELSREKARAREALAGRVSEALGRVAFFVIPTAVAYVVLGDLFVGTLYQGGRFGTDSTTLVYLVLVAYSVGLPASAASRALTSAYYALHDTKTPAIFAVARMILSAGTGIALMFPLENFGVGEVRFGAVGLATGATIAAWMEYAVLRRRLRTHIGDHSPAAGRITRIAVAATAAGAVGVGAKWLLGSATPAWDGLVTLALGGVAPGLILPVLAVGTGFAFGVTYLAVTSALGVGISLGAAFRK